MCEQRQCIDVAPNEQ